MITRFLPDVTDVFLAAQAFVFFAAGFETSATTITHAMYELAFNQDIQERLRAEIKETLDAANGKIVFEDLKKMTYLEQVFRGLLAFLSISLLHLFFLLQ